MDYVFHLATLVGVYCILAIGQYLVLTRGGLVFAVQGALFAIGGYCAALGAINGVPSILAIAIGATASATVGMCIAIPGLRLRNDYLLVASLGVCEIVRSLLNNLDVTGGAAGLTGIPQLTFAGLVVTGPRQFAVVVFVTLISYVFAVKLLHNSPYGRAVAAMGEDPDAAAAAGKDLRRLRLSLLAFTSLWSGLAGGLWAFYLRYLDPSAFTLWESVLVLTIVVSVGHSGLRALMGACAFMLLLPELLRFAGLPQSIGAPVRQIIFGTVLIAAVRYHARRDQHVY
jgi:branched-chain amino acid transport system permease protein